MSATNFIDHLDHIVLTTADEKKCEHFYGTVLGIEVVHFGANRLAFRFGNQKINVHVKGHEFDPKAQYPTPGSLDLCFVAACPLTDVIARLKEFQWPIEEGPVERTGARGRIQSVYVRDPDSNLIEISEYVENHSK